MYVFAYTRQCAEYMETVHIILRRRNSWLLQYEFIYQTKSKKKYENRILAANNNISNDEDNKMTEEKRHTHAISIFSLIAFKLVN